MARLLSLLHSGVQLTCGSELALLLIHDLESDGAAISELHCVLNILEGVQKPYVESRDCAEIAEATKIANAAIRWVKKLVSSLFVFLDNQIFC